LPDILAFNLSGLRQFVYKGWEYTLTEFEKLARKKSYVLRFRMEYYYLITEKIKLKQLVITWAQNAASILKLITVLLKYQKNGKVLPPTKDAIIILLTRNNVYLQTLKPVILHLARNKSNIVVLCPARHYEFVKGQLGKEAEHYLYRIESVSFGDGPFGKIVLSTLRAITDGIWFCFQPVKKSFWMAPVFSRYGFLHRYFGKNLVKYFSSGATLLAANDHWMWESLYFTSAREAKARCYIMQHGVIGDISYPIFADQFLAWGMYDFKKIQDTYGARPEEVRIIGSPHFDEVYKKVAEHKTSTSQFNKPYLTFLSQPFFNSNFMEPGYYQQIIDRFCALAPIAEGFGKKLIIKLHPADKAELYTSVPSNISITHEPLLEILDKSCMAFTVDSTAIFESVLYGVPVMQCLVEGMKRWWDFSITGICQTSTSVDTMKQFALDILGSEPSYQERVNQANEALGQYFYGMGGTLERLDALLGTGI
jgi:hypothetical protein